MRWANTNLGIPIQDFKKEWRQSYLAHISDGKKCSHHNSRFKEGWIPLGIVSFYPALNRFSGKNKLANKIVNVLENKGEYDFSKNSHHFSELRFALEEISGENYHHDIEMIIADKQSFHLMLDRKAFCIDGILDEYSVQWYIRK